MLANNFIPTQGGTTLTTRERKLLKGSVHALVDNLVIHRHKECDETICNSTTLQDDDELQLDLPPNAETLAFEMFLPVCSPQTADFKFDLCAPCCATYEAVVTSARGGGSNAVAYLSNCSGAVTIATDNCGLGAVAATGHVRTGGGGGTLKVQWASDSTSACTTTTVKAGAWIRFSRGHREKHNFPGTFNAL